MRKIRRRVLLTVLVIAHYKFIVYALAFPPGSTPCAAGQKHCPVPIVTGQVLPCGVVADATHVYWASFGDVAITKMLCEPTENGL